MKIAVATYNILHGYHSGRIIENLTLLIRKGINLICIQEADISFKDLLNNFIKNQKWEVMYFHNTDGCNLAITWDPKHLTLQNTKNIFLPKLEKPTLIQWIVDLSKGVQRGALSATFLVDDQVIIVTNVHLAWEGGIKHTLHQLAYINNELNKQQKAQILAGDFNIFIPSIFRRIKEKKIEKVLEDWQNLLPDISWTCDVSYTAPQDGITPYAKFLSSLGFKMRSRLDYIFTKNLKIISKERLDLPGSDHRPLIGTFIF